MDVASKKRTIEADGATPMDDSPLCDSERMLEWPDNTRKRSCSESSRAALDPFSPIPQASIWSCGSSESGGLNAAGELNIDPEELLGVLSGGDETETESSPQVRELSSARRSWTDGTSGRGWRPGDKLRALLTPKLEALSQDVMWAPPGASVDPTQRPPMPDYRYCGSAAAYAHASQDSTMGMASYASCASPHCAAPSSAAPSYAANGAAPSAAPAFSPSSLTWKAFAGRDYGRDGWVPGDLCRGIINRGGAQGFNLAREGLDPQNLKRYVDALDEKQRASAGWADPRNADPPLGAPTAHGSGVDLNGGDSPTSSMSSLAGVTGVGEPAAPGAGHRAGLSTEALGDAFGERAGDISSFPSLQAAVHADMHAWAPAGTSALRTTVERREWTADEDSRIRLGISQHGYRWRRIASQLQGRSDDAVRNRWSRLELQP